MKTKDGSVDIRYLNTHLWNVLGRIEVCLQWYLGESYELMVTSGGEKTAKHMSGSKHYEWCAVDCRVYVEKLGQVFRLTVEESEELQDDLYKALGSDFDIVPHVREVRGVKLVSHVHVEYDPD